MEFINKVLKNLADTVEGVKDEKDMLIRLAIGIVVFLVVLIFKKQLSKLISTVVAKLAFRKSEKAQLAVNQSLVKPLSYFLAVLAFYIATEIVFPTGEIENTVLLILKLVFICMASWFGINIINNEYSFSIKDDSSKARRTAVKFIDNVLKGAIIVVAGLLILEQFGISPTKIFAALGIGGVAVAFACKDTVENMLSGFIIIFDKPFEVDDFIELNGDSGTVKDIKIRTTRLLGVDGCEKIYPNTVMANAAITNWSNMEKRNLSETLWVNYKHSAADIEKFSQGIKKVLLENEKILPDDVRVNFTEFGTHALEISIFCYVSVVDMPSYLQVKSQVNTALKKYADDNGMDFAFESKTIYFDSDIKVEK